MSRKRRDYQLLENEREVFAQWLATPETLRRPATIEEFAATINVHLQTLYRWKNDYTVLNRQSQLIGDRIIESWPAVMKALLATASDSENPRQISSAKFLKDWYEETQVIEETTVEDLSDEEFRKLALKMYDSVDVEEVA